MKWALIVGLAAGCASKDSDTTSQTGHAIALVEQQDARTVFVFANAVYESRLAEVANGQKPIDFNWVSITLPSSLGRQIGPAVHYEVLDLSSANTDIRFAQVYVDVCNPATRNTSQCMIYEAYVAGETGLEGAIDVRLTSDGVLGSWDVAWEGLTTRFEGQEQWHRHRSTAGVYASLKETSP